MHLHFDHSIWCRLLAVLIKLTDVPVVVSLNVSLLRDGEDNDRGNRVARRRRKPFGRSTRFRKECRSWPISGDSARKRAGAICLCWHSGSQARASSW